jgi:NADP-dependent 3-hydroxy acid dehydrogenase YdfG
MTKKYCASKFAIKGFSDAARHDLLGTPIRVTHISPGIVSNTEFSNVRFRAEGEQANTKAAAVYSDIMALHPDDIADNVYYAASAPRHVQIAELIVFATNQAGPRDLARVGSSMGSVVKKN